MKKEFPFFLKIVFFFFLLDGMEKLYLLGNGLFSASNFRLTDPQNMLLIIMASFDFLLIIQIWFRVELVRIWLTFYLLLTILYQGIYFVQIAPQDWFILSLQERLIQIISLFINLTILSYIHSEEAIEALERGS